MEPSGVETNASSFQKSIPDPASTTGSRELCSDKALIGTHRIAWLFPAGKLQWSLTKHGSFSALRAGAFSVGHLGAHEHEPP
jgi:hypothetical protein